MLSFIGWEAVSHLAGELADPARQLPRAIFGALAVVVVLYLGLAVATVGVLGTAAPSDVPLADLMAAGLGAPGRTATALLAVLLTMGAMNAYVAGATKLAGALAAEGAAPAALARPRRALAAFAVLGAALLAALAAEALDVEALFRACGAGFVAVYVISTAAGVRILVGGARRAAASSAGRHERDRPREPPVGDHARELEHQRGAGELRFRARVGGVAVRQQDEPGPARARPGRDHRGHLPVAVDRVRAEAPDADRDVQDDAELVRDPRGQRPVAGAAGPPVGERRRQAVELLRRPDADERVRRQRRPERARERPEREGRDDHHQQRREQRVAVDPRVEHDARD
jgi:hypothetical protein